MSAALRHCEIDEHAPAILALEDARRNPSGHLAEHVIGGFSQELDQLGLVLGLDSRDVDLSLGEVAIDGDCRLHAGIPLLAMRCNGFQVLGRHHPLGSR